MSYFQSYCECKHADHADGGPGHPFSVKISEDEMVPYGWEKGHQVQICRSCLGHQKEIKR